MTIWRVRDRDVGDYIIPFHELLAGMPAHHRVSFPILASTLWLLRLLFSDIFCLFSRQMDTVQVQVLSPLNSLLSLFQGPQRLIQKRNDKCLDYDRWSNKIDRIKDRDKLKAVS